MAQQSFLDLFEKGHVYTAERLRWLKLDDGLPRYPGSASEGDPEG